MQVTGKHLEIISAVLKAAETRRADAALRDALKQSGLMPVERASITRLVFNYYRWRGWLDRSKPLRAQLEHVGELAGHFAANPASIPDRELLERAVPDWAAESFPISPALVREFQREPRLWLRARPGSGEALAKSLRDTAPHPVVPDALWHQGDRDLFLSPEFHSGQFELQDLTSQIVGHFCAPAPGQTWWDACAGEGGKTLHLCDLMQNKGLVWASDPAQWRLAILKRRAGRAKLFNYRVKPWAVTDQLPTKTKFDGVLVDAPCSGIGTWGRNPHARWTLTPRDIAELSAVQSRLLNLIAPSIKPGGRLIYSVCTLALAETRQVADAFESNHSEFEPLITPNPARPPQKLARHELLPQEHHANGMFVALWRRAS